MLFLCSLPLLWSLRRARTLTFVKQMLRSVFTQIQFLILFFCTPVIVFFLIENANDTDLAFCFNYPDTVHWGTNWKTKSLAWIFMPIQIKLARSLQKSLSIFFPDNVQLFLHILPEKFHWFIFLRLDYSYTVTCLCRHNWDSVARGVCSSQ